MLLWSGANWWQGAIADARLYKNGALYTLLGRWVAHNAGTLAPSVSGSTIVNLAAGDYINIYAYQDSGDSVNLASSPVFTSVSVVRVG